MSDKPVVVYGASGYTGRLVCEYLREFNVPFTAAGRDKDRVQAGLAAVPGLETVEHEVVEVQHTVEALTELFTGSRVVCNLVGPFIRYGGEVAEAAMTAGCHYLDTTGEQDWTMVAKSDFHSAFAEKGLIVSPSVAQMYTTGEIAANIALEHPGLDTLDILVLWKGFPTYASTQTIFTVVKADWFYLQQNEYVQWDKKAHYDVVVPGQHELALALPWSGTSHPVWFKDDPRVANVKAVGGVFERSVMQGVVDTVAMYQDQIAPLPPDEQEAKLSEIAGSLQAGMPPRENPRLNTSLESVYASGPLGRVHVVLHGNSNYKQTGLLQAYAAYSLLQQPPRRAGFASACQAFGHRELLGMLRSFGLVMKPSVMVLD